MNGKPLPNAKELKIKQMDSIDTKKDIQEDINKIRRLQKKSHFKKLTDSSNEEKMSKIILFIIYI